MTNINQNPETPKICLTKKIKSCWQNFHPSKPFIATSCILLGIAATLITQNIFKPSYNHHHQMVRNFFPYPSFAFADDDFFADIREMEAAIHQDFLNHQKRMREIFADVERHSGNNNVARVSSSEDADNYYYQIDFSGFTKEEIVVGVKDNILSFAAENKKSGNDKNAEINSSSNFHYSFSIPQYNHKKEPEIIRKDNQIIVKLAKKK